MEKKSIGRFIAALRKANGMTQKQLAEQLNVSDKSVSRWERDESAPDLSLIPVIAEIFHVTSDEILRGERISYGDTDSVKGSEKGRKQILMLLEKARNRFRMFSLITIGIASVGLIGAMICNFGFLRANIGFFVGCIFYLGAFVFAGIALLSILPAIQIEEAEEKEIVTCKYHIIKCFFRTVIVIAGLFFFTLPLFTQVYDAYCGLDFDAWLKSGLPMAVLSMAVGIILWWCISVKKFDALKEKKTETKIKLKYTKRTMIVLAITFLLQLLLLHVIDFSNAFMEGTTFYTYEEFVECMETEVKYEQTWADGMTSAEVLEDEIYYYDENGNEISYEEYEQMYMKEEVYDEQGNLACTYIHRNESVASIEYGHIPYEEGEDMPITIYTHEEMNFQQLIINDIIQPISYLIYIAEMIIGIWFYLRSR